ncbi:unnamed protein product [Parajaminaea phylloscopi]
MHMTNDKTIFQSIEPNSTIVRTAGGHRLIAQGKGTVRISLGSGTIDLTDVLFVPELTESLISLVGLGRSGIHSSWEGNTVTLQRDGKLLAKFELKATESRLIVPTHNANQVVSAAETTETTRERTRKNKARAKTVKAKRMEREDSEDEDVLSDDEGEDADPTVEERKKAIVAEKAKALHNAFSHPGYKQLRELAKTFPELAVNLNPADIRPMQCDPCTMGKATKARITQVTSDEPVQYPLERLDVDLMDQNAGHSSCRFALVIVDKATSFVSVTPLSNKGQARIALTDFVARAERQTGRKLKRVRSDNDSVFLSNAILGWRATEGIDWELTTPYESRLNGTVERMNRTLRERMMTNLLAHKVPYALWPEAIEYAAMCLNLTPRSSDKASPFELFWGRKPDGFLRHLKPFGCFAWAFIPEDKRSSKGGPRRLPAIFIGVSDTRRGWKLYSPHASPSTFWSNSVQFVEDKGWADRTSLANWKELIDNAYLFADRGEDVADLTFSPFDILSTEEEDARRNYVAIEDDAVIEASAVVEDGKLLLNTGHGDDSPGHDLDCTWRSLTIQETTAAATTAETLEVPANEETYPSVQQALSGQNAHLWREAIRKEIEGLEANGTWETEDLPEGEPAIDSKLVLRIKLTPDGKPLKCKARLVARGFTQREGIDYEQTFSPVAPYSAIRAVLAIASSQRWHIHSTDFTQAYLNGQIDKAIYMTPPRGLDVPKGKVFKILKGLYGLKQSGRLWHNELDALLRSIGLVALESAPCIYMGTVQEGKPVIVCTYVDDCLFVSPCERSIGAVKEACVRRFKMEDNGPVTMFCGINVAYDREQGVLRMHQRAYLESLLSEFGIDTNKTAHRVKIPIDRTLPEVSDYDQSIQPTYRRIVGKITWAANHTRPDLSFAAGVLQRHLHAPSQVHLDAALKLLRYIAATVDYELYYAPSQDSYVIEGFSDANWASDIHVKRRSTSGFAIYVYGCLVSWKTSVQKCVALSAVEAEMVAASDATRDVLFFHQLLRELGILTTPRLNTDSLGCVQVAHDPAHHWKLKHIDTRYHFLRHHVQSGDLHVAHIRTEHNCADLFTKPLGKNVFHRHRLQLQLKPPAFDAGGEEGC